MPAEAGPRHRTVHYRRPQTQTSAKAELWTRGLQQWGRRLHHTQKITFFSKLIYEYITDQMYQRVWMDSVYNRMFGDYQEWRNGHCTNQIVGKNLRIVVATVTRDSLLDHILAWSFSVGTRWLSISSVILPLMITYRFLQSVARHTFVDSIAKSGRACILVQLFVKNIVLRCSL